MNFSRFFVYFLSCLLLFRCCVLLCHASCCLDGWMDRQTAPFIGQRIAPFIATRKNSSFVRRGDFRSEVDCPYTASIYLPFSTYSLPHFKKEERRSSNFCVFSLCVLCLLFFFFLAVLALSHAFGARPPANKRISMSLVE